MSSVLSKKDILALVQHQPPLVEDYLNMEEQVQPNGFDLTVRDVARTESQGRVTVDNKERRVADLSPLGFDRDGFMDLLPGAYVITYNEVVHLPVDVMALGAPRSSLLRCGVTVHMAVWDAGYSGRSQSLLVVFNPQGFRLQKNARVAQLVFLKLTGETEGYRGVYQNENIR